MRFTILSALVLLCFGTPAATYYVTTNGNNNADGSLATPWSNVWYAASQVTAGATVNIGPGIYNEFVTNTASGSVGSPITFNGTRGAGGEWLTIIDPSTAVTSWTAADEIGDGVWKSTTPFAARALTISNKTVMGPYTTGAVNSSTAYSSGAPATGAGFLTFASNGQVVTKSDITINFWDAMGALWTAEGTTLYLRLRDGSDPTGLPITIAPNGNTAGSPDVYRPAITINGKSYITWQNIKVQGAFSCVYVTGNSHHNTILSNYLQNGASRIYLLDGPSNNVVQGNELTSNYYGTTNLGAWVNGSTTVYGDRDSTYEFSKYVFSSEDSSLDRMIYSVDAGNSNVFCWNHLFRTFGSGITVWGYTATVHGTQIFSNTVEQCSSVGITPEERETELEIHGNYVSDCNSQFRFHKMNSSARTVFLYRNRSWLPDNVGNHIFFHFDGAPSYYPTNWIYNNSFSGGYHGFEMGTSYTIYNTHFLNNVFSATIFVKANDTFKNTASYVGAFDYNWVRPISPDPAWFGENNVSSSTNCWTSASGMSFALPVDSQAIGAGLDLPTTYPTLPQDGTVKRDSEWDIGALEYVNPCIQTWNGQATLGAGARLN